MDVIPLVLSGGSLVVATIGTTLSYRRSGQALRESQKAASSALWSAVQEAVQRLIGFDPASEPLGDRLANLRIAMIALVDELDDWAGLDEWLEAERSLGATLGRQVMEHAKPGESVDQRLKVLDPLQSWAQALGGNLRRFRSQGYDTETAAKFRDHASALAKEIHKRNGWQLPPTANPRIQPLD